MDTKVKLGPVSATLGGEPLTRRDRAVVRAVAFVLGTAMGCGLMWLAGRPGWFGWFVWIGIACDYGTRAALDAVKRV